MCEGPLASIGILERATDPGPEPGERPLSIEVLVELVALVAALEGLADGETER